MKTYLLLISFALLLAGPVLAGQPYEPMEREFEANIQIQNVFGEVVPGVRCGTVDLAPDWVVRAPADLHAWAKENSSADKALVATIPVAFHVLYYYSNRYGGYVGEVTDQQITDQIAVLNAAYLNYGFQFTHFSTDRTENKKWATMRPGSKDEIACKTALAVDVAHTLNIYSTYPSGGLLGWSYFPEWYPEDDPIHGTVIHFGTVPGGYAAPYNEGDTATHEIGHYLGLYHTFQGGCSEPNDYCADTPQEATATFGCPHGQDSCPNDPGLDPIYNFMDYTDDYCMYEFTTDQALRMDWAVTTYRPSLVGAKARPVDPVITSGGPAIISVSPNPFNPMTEIKFSLDQGGPVRLSVYDLAGHRVKTLIDQTMAPGVHQVIFDGTGMPSSVYFTVLDTGGQTVTKRMMLIK